MRLITVGFIGIVAFVLNACSWQESFIVKNQSDEDLVVYYQLKNPTKSFAIFSYTPQVYKLKNNYELDWNSEINILDMDTAILQIKIIIPPKHALVLGHLSNDKYKKYNQDFINDREFNLDFLKISNTQHQVYIVPETFDNYFKKQSGNIVLGISN